MSAPTEVVDLATACIASVNATVGITLDFSAETLPLLDHYAKSVLDSPEEEILALIAPLCGAYFGEVVRRRFEGARWHAPKDDHATWRLEFDHVFLFFNPIGVALDVILEGDGPFPSNLQVRKSDQEIVQQAIAVYGEVKETDYYSFTVRLEGIEQALVGMARNHEPETHSATAYQQYVDGLKTN